MGKFVADGSYTARRAVEPQFAAVRIVRDFLPVFGGDGCEGSGVGPYISTTAHRHSVHHAFALVTRKAGKHIDNLVHRPVVIPVIHREVDVGGIDEHACGGYHGLLAIVAGRRVGVGIGLCLFVGFERSIHIELQVAQSPRLLAEVFGHAAGTVSVVVARCVEHVVIERLRVFVEEVGIGERHQNHRLTIHAVGVPLCFKCRQPALCGSLCSPSHGLFAVQNVEHALRILLIHLPVGAQEIAEALVARHGEREHSAIGLLIGFPFNLHTTCQGPCR